MAAIYDRFMRGAESADFGRWRHELLATVGGRVLEVGAGTGVNLGAYGPDVSELVLCEPDPSMRAKLSAKLPQHSALPCQLCDGSAEALPFDDARFDVVVSTLVLCSVGDPRAALSEIRRVLVPGGQLVFMEHVAALDDPSLLGWQRRIEPLWRPLAGNCHLTRSTADSIGAQLSMQRLERARARGVWPIIKPVVRGVATKA